MSTTRSSSWTSADYNSIVFSITEDSKTVEVLALLSLCCFKSMTLVLSYSIWSVNYSIKLSNSLISFDWLSILICAFFNMRPCVRFSLW